MIIPQLFIRNRRLFRCKFAGFQNFLHPPFVAACGGEHTAHQMVMPVSVGEGVEGIVRIYPKCFTGNEDSA